MITSNHKNIYKSFWSKYRIRSKIMKKITISDESYWNLMEIKVKLKCRTWKETINELHKIVFETNSAKDSI